MTTKRRLVELIEQRSRTTPLFLHYELGHQDLVWRTCKSTYLWMPLGPTFDSMRIFDELLAQLSPVNSIRYAHNTQSSIASLRWRFNEINGQGYARPIVVIDNFQRFNKRDSSKMIAYLLETAGLANTVLMSHTPIKRFNAELLEDKCFKMLLELVPERRKF